MSSFKNQYGDQVYMLDDFNFVSFKKARKANEVSVGIGDGIRKTPFRFNAKVDALRVFAAALIEFADKCEGIGGKEDDG